MKTLIRLAVTGALIAGGSAAFAQNLPSSDNADLWLFVSNGTSSTFAEDTGISIASLEPSSFTAGASNLAAPKTIDLPATAALTSYLAANSGASLSWTVEAEQYSGATGTASTNEAAGLEVGILGTQVTTGLPFSNFSKLGNWGVGFQNDMQYITSSYTAGGTTFLWANGTATGNVWGFGFGTSGPGSTNEYGQGPNTYSIAPSSAADGTAAPAANQEALYLLTGNGNAGKAQSYLLGEFQLNNGILENVPTLATPIPAALWLFGSGLLGLVGVGRRRNAAAA